MMTVRSSEPEEAAMLVLIVAVVIALAAFSVLRTFAVPFGIFLAVMALLYLMQHGALPPPIRFVLGL